MTIYDWLLVGGIIVWYIVSLILMRWLMPITKIEKMSSGENEIYGWRWFMWLFSPVVFPGILILMVISCVIYGIGYPFRWFSSLLFGGIEEE